MSRPLKGIRIVRSEGIERAPFFTMLLSETGADAARVDRAGAKVQDDSGFNPTLCGRRSARLDLKGAAGREAALGLIECIDALIEGFRAGAMQRFGFAADAVLARNSRLTHRRMTAWDQYGVLAKAGISKSPRSLKLVRYAVGGASLKGAGFAAGGCACRIS